MHRRRFLHLLGAGLSAAGCARANASAGTRAAPGARGGRRLARVGIQLYTLRDAARRDFERTLADIAAIGYREVELLQSINDNFGTPAPRVRAILDRVGLRAPSTHTTIGYLREDLDRHLDEAAAIGHEYLIVASIPAAELKTLDDWRARADDLNRAGEAARRRGIWVGFHNHAGDFAPVEGQVPYDLFIERTDPRVVRHQLDTGNLAAAGRDPMDYLARYGARYWQFHIKDPARPPATGDTELGSGTLDFRRLLAAIDRVDEKHFYVEQENYPGPPIESARRDFEYLSRLEF